MIQEIGDSVEKRARQIVYEVEFALLQEKNDVVFEKQTEFLGCAIEELLSDLGDKVLEFAQINQERAQLFKEQLNVTTVWTYPAITFLKLAHSRSDRKIAGLLLTGPDGNPAIIVPDGLFPHEMAGIREAAKRGVQPGEDLDKIVEVAGRLTQKRLVIHELLHLLRGDHLGIEVGQLPLKLIEDSIEYFALQIDRFNSTKPEILSGFEGLVGSENLAKRVLLTNDVSLLPSGFQSF